MNRTLASLALVLLVVAALGACKQSPMDKAREATERGDFTTAIQWYMEALKANPQDKAARAGLSETRLRYARQFVIDAVRGQHNDTVDWERLLEHLEQEGDGVKMELLDAYYTVSEMYRKAGQRDKAFQVLSKALARDPSRRIPLGKLNDLIKGAKDGAWGRGAFEALWKQSETDTDLCTKFAAYLGSLDLHTEAIEQYQKCLALNPADFTYANDIRMEITTLEKRRKARAERTAAQPGAMSGGGD